MRYEYKCVIHLHSRYSDGSGTMEEIISKAQQTDLDCVMLSDHNSLAARRDGYEGWHDSTLLLVGNEISPRDHHYLAFGADEEINATFCTNPRSFVQRVADQGGLGIIAHPFSNRPKFFPVDPGSWTAWDIDLFDGIEIWSYMVDWIEQVAPWTLLHYYRYPERAIRGPHPKALQKWDEVAQKRRVIGIGSIDGHAKPLPIFRFIKFLPYEHLFRTIRTHVLTDSPLAEDVEIARWQVYEAIRQGRCFIGYDALGHTTGFRLEACDGEWQMGEEHQLTSPVDLEIRVPYPSDIRLLCDGTPVASVHGKHLKFSVSQPGVYRAEVSLDGTPWIFSNPLFLRPSP